MEGVYPDVTYRWRSRWNIKRVCLDGIYRRKSRWNRNTVGCLDGIYRRKSRWNRNTVGCLGRIYCIDGSLDGIERGCV